MRGVSPRRRIPAASPRLTAAAPPPVMSGLVCLSVAIWAITSSSAGDAGETALAVMYSYLIPYYLSFVAQIVSMLSMYAVSFQVPSSPPRAQAVPLTPSRSASWSIRSCLKSRITRVPRLGAMRGRAQARSS